MLTCWLEVDVQAVLSGLPVPGSAIIVKQSDGTVELVHLCVVNMK